MNGIKPYNVIDEYVDRNMECGNSYGDSNWKDKVTAINGTPITYDVTGNSISDGTRTYVWEHGRQLKQVTKSGTASVYAYNEDGLRVRKTVGSTVTNYTLHGKQIVHMTQGSNSLHFFYDAQGRPAEVELGGTRYGYILNMQGAESKRRQWRMK